MTRIQGDLVTRTFEFGVAVVRLVDRLPDGTVGWAVAKQLVRSGTSVGANVAEADTALTDREFAHLANIARREASETRYWLRLAEATELLPGNLLEPMVNEATELLRILTTIVRKQLNLGSVRKRAAPVRKRRKPGICAGNRSLTVAARQNRPFSDGA